MKKTDPAAIAILSIMLILMLGSAWNDSAIMDELAHIPAGYSYVTQADYRLNPEHPPLLKDLAGLSTLIFAHPYFPTGTTYWQDDVNGQWAQGAAFLYESGNNADKIIFWSRVPLMLLTILFGFLLFLWTRKRLGSRTALLTLTFFAFSPTLLTHGRFVTTDIGAAFGFFIGIATLLAFLENPSWRNVILAGAAFGIAELLKFSLVLLLPLYLIVIFAWVMTRPTMHTRERAALTGRLLGKTIIIGAVALSIIWGVYAFHTWNYPAERQARDTQFLLGSYGLRTAVNLDLALVRHPITRPLAQYILGILMVQQRAGGGNTAFFLGSVSGAGSRVYFPLLYLLKEPLAFHILSLIALGYAVISTGKKKPHSLRALIENHFMGFSALSFIALYWAVSIKSPLNIGVRHVLPTFPFLYMLVAHGITNWLRAHGIDEKTSWQGSLKNIYHLYIRPAPKYILTGLLLLWLASDTILAFPHFMPYYNELAGGAAHGYEIAVDSNYDWGQDLKRLADFVRVNNIQKIAVDYFGGGSPRYYLGDRFEPWRSSRGAAHGYFAISISSREGAFGAAAPGFNRKPEDSYEWLKPFQPVANIGHSILVYNLP